MSGEPQRLRYRRWSRARSSAHRAAESGAGGSCCGHSRLPAPRGGPSPAEGCGAMAPMGALELTAAAGTAHEGCRQSAPSTPEQSDAALPRARSPLPWPGTQAVTANSADTPSPTSQSSMLPPACQCWGGVFHRAGSCTPFPHETQARGASQAGAYRSLAGSRQSGDSPGPPLLLS